MRNRLGQNLIHRGTVPAAGFLFSARLLPETEIRRRVLLLWQPDARVLRHGEFVFLLFPQPFSVDCRIALGLPLVRYNQVLSSFPLAKSDLEQLIDSHETILLLIAGSLQKIEVRDLSIEKVETWFDVSDFKAVETETLGEVKTAPVLIEKVTEINLREELKAAVPAADAEMMEILKVLREKQTENLKNKTNPILSGQSFTGGSSSNASFPNLFASAFDTVKNLFANKSGQSQSSSFELRPPSDISGKLRQFFTKALFQMRVAQIFGRKQARYLAEMMEMFERGDLQEALKHAIPLEDMQALQQLTEKAPFLGFLRPRADLQIKLGRQRAAGSSVFLENDWFKQLSKTYRQTFERLAAQGKIEEAAFVLAELLKSNAEAVEFLEKHGQLQLAAELAEARDLPKETVVRQWFIAGAKRRAIQLAVLHNCFEYVVTKLEKENHPQSGELRELWAENLAASGNLPAAVNIIWSLEKRREKAQDWIEQVIEFGGLPAAQMLVKKITLFPETFSEVKKKLFEFLPEESLEAAEKRIGFAREAIIQKANEELSILARPVVRKILADWSENKGRFSASEFRQLVAAANDFALRTDLPNLPPTQQTTQNSEIFNLEISAHDRGANHIFDACLLPDGRIAVALGEAGVKILSRENKTIVHFDQPTQKFVVSDLGTKAVGLMPRGDSYRLTKFDFLKRRADYWCEASFLQFAPTFDGNLWFVGLTDALYAIDTNARDFEAVWRVSEIGGNVYEVSRSKTKLIMVVKMPGKGVERWSYDLPNLVLRSRNQVKGWLETKSENQVLLSLSSSVAYSIALKQEAIEKDETRFDVEIFDYETRVGNFQIPGQTVGFRKPQIVDDRYLIINYREGETIVTLYSIPNKKTAVFRLHGTSSGAARLDEKFLTITDDRGRILVFDYREEILRKNLRY